MGVAQRKNSSRNGVLFVISSIGLVALLMGFGRAPDSAEAAIQGTIRGSAQTLSGSLTLNNGSGTIAIPNPNVVSLPVGGSSSEAIDFTDPGSLTVRITGSASVECNGSNSAPLVIDATCTSTITNFALSFQSITAITIGKLVMKSQTVATSSTTVSASTGTTMENVCVKEGLGLPCKAIPPGGSVSFTFPPMSGTVSLQTEARRQTDGNLTGSGLRVTGVRISLTLIPTQQAPTGGSLSLTLGIADTFIGGLSMPTVPATNTAVASPTPTRTPTPSGPPDPRPHKAVLPIVSRDD